MIECKPKTLPLNKVLTSPLTLVSALKMRAAAAILLTAVTVMIVGTQYERAQLHMQVDALTARNRLLREHASPAVWELINETKTAEKEVCQSGSSELKTLFATIRDFFPHHGDDEVWIRHGPRPGLSANSLAHSASVLLISLFSARLGVAKCESGKLANLT